MASVNGFTAERMQAIEDETIVSAAVVGGHLILTRHDTVTVDAGPVIGPAGPTGAAGPTSIVVCTAATRPTGGARFEGLEIYETDTDRMYVWDGVNWIPRGVGLYICTNATRPVTVFNGLEIFETDTGNFYYYSGGGWLYKGPKLPHTKVASVPAAGFGTTSSTAYVDLPSALSLAGFIKYRGDTSLVITISGFITIDDANASVTLGINIGGTVTDACVVLSGVSVGEVKPFSSTIEITGLAAATIATIKAQWKVGAGTVVATEAGTWSMVVTETL